MLFLLQEMKNFPFHPFFVTFLLIIPDETDDFIINNLVLKHKHLENIV